MQDKRIKQITTEMFIAWGVICVVFFILDSLWWKSGIIALSTSHSKPDLSRVGFIVFFLVLISNLPGLYLSHCICGLFFIPQQNMILHIVWLFLFVIIQATVYWYLGNLTGRFIVWIKQSLKSNTMSTKEDGSCKTSE
jgi:hypothetical protein